MSARRRIPDSGESLFVRCDAVLQRREYLIRDGEVEHSVGAYVLHFLTGLLFYPLGYLFDILDIKHLQ